MLIFFSFRLLAAGPTQETLLSGNFGRSGGNFRFFFCTRWSEFIPHTAGRLANRNWTDIWWTTREGKGNKFLQCFLCITCTRKSISSFVLNNLFNFQCFLYPVLLNLINDLLFLILICKRWRWLPRLSGTQTQACIGVNTRNS